MSACAPSSLFVATLALVLPVPAQETAAQDKAKQEAKIDRLFRAYAHKDSPGAAVLIVHEGKVVFRQGYGMASLDHGVEIAPDTVFDIASVSKQFCGLAIAMLVTQKKLVLDDDVRQHVPWVPFGDKKGEVITIRHLLHHTSGLRDWPATLKIAGIHFEDVISFPQILEMVRKQRDLNFAPGAEYTYSNTGYNLLAHVVEKVSDQSFSSWCRKHIFDPLGMKNTHFHDDHTKVVPRRATSYRFHKSEWKAFPNQLMAVGSSSLYTTIDDLAKWILNFETKKVGGKAALALMHERGALNNGKQLDYAFGVVHGKYRGQATISHGGSWAGFRTVITRYPKERFAVVILGNTTAIQGVLSKRVAEVWLGKEVLPSPPKSSDAKAKGGRLEAAADAWSPATEDYIGDYYSPELETSYRVSRRGKKELVLLHFRNEDAELKLTPNKDTFGSNRWWCRNLVFVRDKNGRVVEFRISAGGRVRNVQFVRRK